MVVDVLRDMSGCGGSGGSRRKAGRNTLGVGVCCVGGVIEVGSDNGVVGGGHRLMLSFQCLVAGDEDIAKVDEEAVDAAQDAARHSNDEHHANDEAGESEGKGRSTLLMNRKRIDHGLGHRESWTEDPGPNELEQRFVCRVGGFEAWVAAATPETV